MDVFEFEVGGVGFEVVHNFFSFLFDEWVEEGEIVFEVGSFLFLFLVGDGEGGGLML